MGLNSLKNRAYYQYSLYPITLTVYAKNTIFECASDHRKICRLFGVLKPIGSFSLQTPGIFVIKYFFRVGFINVNYLEN